jgi:hypothetical protein
VPWDRLDAAYHKPTFSRKLVHPTGYDGKPRLSSYREPLLETESLLTDHLMSFENPMVRTDSSQNSYSATTSEKGLQP